MRVLYYIFALLLAVFGGALLPSVVLTVLWEEYVGALLLMCLALVVFALSIVCVIAAHGT